MKETKYIYNFSYTKISMIYLFFYLFYLFKRVNVICNFLIYLIPAKYYSNMSFLLTSYIYFVYLINSEVVLVSFFIPFSNSLIRSLSIPIGHVVIPSIFCILLSSFLDNAILLTSSVVMV